MEILNKKSFPQYVFTNQFQKFLFFEVSEALGNQMDELMFLLTTALKKTESKKIFSYEVGLQDLLFIKMFNIMDVNPQFIADFFISYRDEYNIPYYCQVASLLFIDEAQNLCLYGDRRSDLCILGCSRDIYNNLISLSIKRKRNRYFLNFMDVHEFLDYKKRYLPETEYDDMKKQVLVNYLGQD